MSRNFRTVFHGGHGRGASAAQGQVGRNWTGAVTPRGDWRVTPPGDAPRAWAPDRPDAPEPRSGGTTRHGPATGGRCPFRSSVRTTRCRNILLHVVRSNRTGPWSRGRSSRPGCRRHCCPWSAMAGLFRTDARPPCYCDTKSQEQVEQEAVRSPGLPEDFHERIFSHASAC